MFSKLISQEIIVYSGEVLLRYASLPAAPALLFFALFSYLYHRNYSLQISFLSASCLLLVTIAAINALYTYLHLHDARFRYDLRLQQQYRNRKYSIAVNVLLFCVLCLNFHMHFYKQQMLFQELIQKSDKIGSRQFAYDEHTWLNSLPAKLNLPFRDDIIISSLLQQRAEQKYSVCDAHSLKGLKFKVIIPAKLGDKEITPGSLLKVDAVINLPLTALNESDFDYRRYLAGKGIYLELQIKAFSISSVADLPFWQRLSAKIYSLQNVKYHVQRYFRSILPPQDAGFLQALLFANGEYLDKDDKQAFQSAGIIHTLVASGQHVQIFMLCILAFIESGKLKWRYRQLCAVFCLLLSAFIYFTDIAFVRACLQYLCLRIAQVRHMNYSKLSVLLFSTVLILLIRPYLIADISLQLSFVAAFVIYEAAPALSRKSLLRKSKGSLHNILCSSSRNLLILCLIQSAYSVCGLLHDKLSLSLIAGNILLLSQFCLLVPALFLISGCDIVFFALFNRHPEFASNLLKTLLRYIRAASAAINNYEVAAVGRKDFLMLSMLMIILTAILKELIIISKTTPVLSTYRQALSRLKLKSVCLAALLIYSGFTAGLHLAFSINFVAVGQGDACIIAYRRQVNTEYILIDGGPAKHSRNLKNYLRDKGIKKIDLALITHFDEDHYGGIMQLAQAKQIRSIVANLPLEPKKLKIYRQLQLICEANDIKLQTVPISTSAFRQELLLNRDLSLFLWRAGSLESTHEENDFSFTCNLLYRGQSVLCLTGDITRAAEEIWLKDSAFPVHSHILKVAHHGSAGSTGEAFLKKLSPRFAVICAGRFNRYAHPHGKVLQRLHNGVDSVYRTDLQGTVSFVYDIFNDTPQVSTAVTYADACGYFACYPCAPLRD